jgi:hypothetical protein
MANDRDTTCLPERADRNLRDHEGPKGPGRGERGVSITFRRKVHG